MCCALGSTESRLPFPSHHLPSMPTRLLANCCSFIRCQQLYFFLFYLSRQLAEHSSVRAGLFSLLSLFLGQDVTPYSCSHRSLRIDVFVELQACIPQYLDCGRFFQNTRNQGGWIMCIFCHVFSLVVKGRNLHFSETLQSADCPFKQFKNSQLYEKCLSGWPVWQWPSSFVSTTVDENWEREKRRKLESTYGTCRFWCWHAWACQA